MPFTFSHPAIILPLQKASPKYFNFTALVIGSLAPDLPYFLSLSYTDYGHHLPGLMALGLPLTLIFSWLFHNLIKIPLISNLPKFIQTKLPINSLKPFQLRDSKDWLVFAYSAILGIFSHIFWDGFTHVDGFFVERISFLQDIFEFLQILSSFVGLLAIVVYIAHILFSTDPKSRLLLSSEQPNISSAQKMAFWANMGGLFVAMFSLNLAIHPWQTVHLHFFYQILYLMDSLGLAIFVVCLFWKIVLMNKNKQQAFL